MAAVLAGESCRAVAAQFGVSVSSVVKWSRRLRATGSVAPGNTGGHTAANGISEMTADVLFAPSQTGDATFPAKALDAAGCLVLPGLFNLHFHADKCLLGEIMRPNQSGTLPEAMAGIDASLGSCAHCGEPPGDAYVLLVRRRGEARVPDAFCSVGHLEEWAKAGGRWR